MSGSRKPGHTFPKSARLRTRNEFLRVQNRGWKVSSEHLMGLALKKEGAPTRVGFTVSSKVGTAVVRNRIRRRLKEIYRKRQALLPEGIELVFIAKQSSATADFASLTRSVEFILDKMARHF